MALDFNNTASKGKKDFGVAQEGTQMARLVRIIDTGLQPRPDFNDQPKSPAFMLRLTFELPNDRIEVDGESRPRWIDVEFPLSSHEKSKCFQWYNILDPDNKYNNDWSKLIATPCLIAIKHRNSNGKTYANIVNIMPTMTGIEVPALENPSFVFDLTSPDIEKFKILPQWLQDKIKGNLEFQNSKLDRLLSDLPVPATATTGNTLDEEAEVDTKPASKKPEIEVPLVNLDDFDDEDSPF